MAFILFLFVMPFENEYIEKYGEKAVEAYKRSLRHSDVKESTPKSSRVKPQLKRSASCSRHPSVGKGNSSNGVKKGSNKSTIINPSDKSKHRQLNSVQLYLHPTKKKLVIGDVSTPRETPLKANMGKKTAKPVATTNVNVYVNAMNRSKSKESTPCRDKGERKKSRRTANGGELLNQAISSLSDYFSEPEDKNVHKALDTLQKLQRVMHK